MKKTSCISFLAAKEEEGYSAKAIGFPIFTQGDTFEELQNHIKEALELHFEDEANVKEFTYDISLEEASVCNGFFRQIDGL